MPGVGKGPHENKHREEMWVVSGKAIYPLAGPAARDRPAVSFISGGAPLVVAARAHPPGWVGGRR